MVRLVFRPYTQIRRSICTLESLRASTRVSPGFALHRHSSPSFGSQQICSHSNLSSENHDRSMVRLAPPTAGVATLYFHCAPRVWHPSTRIYVRLLGPCFKTGRGQAFRQASWDTYTSVGGTARCPGLKKRTPAVKQGRCTSPERKSRAANWCWHKPLREEQPILPAAASLLAISSPLHSLFKVLFIFPSRYLFAIGLLLIFSFRWNLPPTLSCTRKQLDSMEACRTRRCRVRTGLAPSAVPHSMGVLPAAFARRCPSRLQFGQCLGAPGRFSSWAHPCSLAVTRGILVSFFSSA